MSDFMASTWASIPSVSFLSADLNVDIGGVEPAKQVPVRRVPRREIKLVHAFQVLTNRFVGADGHGSSERVSGLPIHNCAASGSDVSSAAPKDRWASPNGGPHFSSRFLVLQAQQVAGGMSRPHTSQAVQYHLIGRSTGGSNLR
jgi:hypothetical protein